MDREQEINEQANAWVDMFSEVEYLKPHPTWQDLIIAFKAGAHWDGSHQSDETIEKIGLIAIDWITNIGGNNMVEYIRQHLNDDTTNKQNRISKE